MSHRSTSSRGQSLVSVLGKAHLCHHNPVQNRISNTAPWLSRWFSDDTLASQGKEVIVDCLSACDCPVSRTDRMCNHVWTRHSWWSQPVHLQIERVLRDVPSAEIFYLWVFGWIDQSTTVDYYWLDRNGAFQRSDATLEWSKSCLCSMVSIEGKERWGRFLPLRLDWTSLDERFRK